MTLATAVKTALVDTEKAQEFAVGYQVGQTLTAKDRRLLRVLRDAGSFPVIDLRTLMIAGSGKGRFPQLAIASADDATCKVTVSHQNVKWASANFSMSIKRDKVGVRSPGSSWYGTNTRTAIADVPLTPPELRTEEPLAEMAVAWEAQWRDEKVTRRYPDPILLKHLSGDLYAVLGTWNMTKVEQAALRLARIG